jgi:hypothetical protein
MKFLNIILLLALLVPCRAEDDDPKVTEMLAIDPVLTGLWMVIGYKFKDKDSVVLPEPQALALVRPRSIKFGEAVLNVKDAFLVEAKVGDNRSITLTFTNDTVCYEISETTNAGTFMLQVYEDLTDDGEINMVEKSRYLFTVEK